MGDVIHEVAGQQVSGNALSLSDNEFLINNKQVFNNENYMNASFLYNNDATACDTIFSHHEQSLPTDGSRLKTQSQKVPTALEKLALELLPSNEPTSEQCRSYFVDVVMDSGKLIKKCNVC